MAPHPTLPLLASSGIDCEVKVWDVDGEWATGSGGRRSRLEARSEGRALLSQGAWVEASGCFEEVEGLEEDEASLLDLALCHLNLEEFQEAEQRASQALALSRSGVALRRRAAARLGQRDLRAAEDLAEAEDVEPEHSERPGEGEKRCFWGLPRLPRLRAKLKKLRKR